MKLKYKSLILLAIVGIFALNSCEDTEIERANYISFEKETYSFPIEVGSSSSAEVKVYTTQVTGSDRTFTINVNSDLTTADSNDYTIDQTVTVPANTNVGTFNVTSTDANIGTDIVVEFAAGQSILTGEAMTIEVSQLCTTNPLTLIFVFDDYPEETSWEIYSVNDLSNPVVDGGGYDGLSGITEYLCLDDGDYYFVIYDVYADGICCNYGNGSYTLIDGDGATLVTGGSFGANQVTPFSLP